MNEIKCPKCHTVFKIDEADYESVVRQVRDKEFEKDLADREKAYQKDKENSIKLAEAKLEGTFKEEINRKDLRINDLTNELKSKEEETTNKLTQKYDSELSKRDLEIASLKGELELQKVKGKAEIKDALAEKDNKINELKSALEANKNEHLLKEQSLKENYESKLKDREEQIAYYKDFKAKQSTKMIGESLEVHCSNEFNKLRPLFANAYFEKDNDIKSGSKGDFIFRDYDDDGIEIVSIMFEMKNEADTTSTKHRNEDFFKELDKDRKEKNCEYAVLVSLLEIDSDYYNEGIIDVSYKYEKMYVIRPQFFIPLITLIRGLAINSLKYKRDLIALQNQNIDISHFEENMNSFKDAFGRNYRLASEKFKRAIEEIDKTIDHLQKTKDALLSSENNLRLANNKAEDLSIKKLTRNSPTVAKMFEELEENAESVEV